VKSVLRVRVVFCVLLLAAGMRGQTVAVAAPADVPSEQVQLYVHTSRTIPLEDVSAAVSLDETVCRAQITTAGVQVTGLNRGQAALLLWAGDKRTNLLVDVVDPPAVAVSPTLRRASDFGVHGIVSATAAITNTPTSTSGFGTTNVDWTETINHATQLHLGGTFLNEIGSGGRTMNVARASLGYASPIWRLNLLDFTLTPRGMSLLRRPGSDPAPLLTLRGADVRWQSGATGYEFFGGTTVPSYFLTLSKTGRVAGMLAEHHFNDAFRVYNTVVYSGATDLLQSAQNQRTQSVLNISGVEWQARKALFVAANTGVSSLGNSGSASIDYLGTVLDGFAAVRHYDSDFPLRNLRAMSDVGTTVTSGLGFALSTRVRLYGYFDHRFPGADHAGGAVERFSASSSYGAHTTVAFSRANTGSFVYSATTPTLTNALKLGGVQRFDATFASVLSESLQNTADWALSLYNGSNGLDNHSEWAMQDSVRWRVKPSLAVSGGISYGRTNLSLATRIGQQLSLLTSEQAALFQRDPAAFLNSPDLPPELRALFEALQPSQTSIQAGIEWARARWRIAPNLRMGFNTGDARQHSYDFGYTATYSLSQTTFLQSSLSHQYYVSSNSTVGLNRTTQFTLGVVKEFSRNPMRWLSQKVQGNQINGRVFVDRSLRGVFVDEALGLAGVRVVLDDGRSTTTDKEGQYQFLRLSDRIYHVSIPIDQFATAVRLTTPSPATVDLRNRRTATVDFGVVNFSRVIVLAYNDYLLNGSRQPDAPLITDLKLHLVDAKGRHRILLSTGGGDYEASKIEPGTYEVQVVADSVPTGYSLTTDRMTVKVESASSAVVNLPFRAMRSISGALQFRATKPDGTSELRPLAGVALKVGERTVTTGQDGTFLVRDLPAGEVQIRVLCCAGEVPSGLRLPSGVIRLGRDPQQLENVNITITNSELLTYILPAVVQNR
jgi:hypothetical protein